MGQRGHSEGRGPPCCGYRAPGAHAPARVAGPAGLGRCTYPEGIVEFLDRVGLAGPEVCFAHGTQLRADELAALARRGCVLALNASSNLRLCSGIAPVALARQSGVALGAGLDGLALGDDGDYWTELRLLRGLEQAQTGRVVEALDFIERFGRRAGRSGHAAPAGPRPQGGLRAPRRQWLRAPARPLGGRPPTSLWPLVARGASPRSGWVGGVHASGIDGERGPA